MSDNVFGSGFKHQTGPSRGLDRLRPADEVSRGFNYGLPGSSLPLPTKPLTADGAVSVTGIGADADIGTATAEGLTVAILLVVQDSYVRNVPSPDTGVDYPAGSVGVIWKDEDVKFEDDDVVWHAHATTGTNGSATPSGDVLAADLGTAAVSAGANVAATGHQIDANVGTAAVSVAVATQAGGDVLAADVGTAAAVGAANAAISGDVLAADAGTIVVRGAASVAVAGDELAANAGTPTIGGAGVAAPGGDVGSADVGSAELSASSAVAVSGDELTADVGDAVASAQTFVYPEDAYHENVADSPALVLTNGEAFPVGVEADADVGAAVAVGVVPVTGGGKVRTYVPREYLESLVRKPEQKPLELSTDGVAVVGGLVCQTGIGAVVVSATQSARVVPFTGVARGAAGHVVASVDYTLRDEQEEELVQLLLAA